MKVSAYGKKLYFWLASDYIAKCNGVNACSVKTSKNFNGMFAFFQISPSSLTGGGVDVTRVVQKQGQFVVVFPEVRTTPTFRG